MEHDIDEVVVFHDGRKAVVEEISTPACEGCMFDGMCDTIFDTYVLGECSHRWRTDHKNIIYKEIK